MTTNDQIGCCTTINQRAKAEYQLKYKISTLVLIARFSSSAGEVKKSKVKICLIIISKKKYYPDSSPSVSGQQKIFGEGL